MSDPSFESSKKKLEKHLQCLIGQPVREFQLETGFMITEIKVELVDVSSVSEKIQIITQIKIQ